MIEIVLFFFLVYFPLLFTAKKKKKFVLDISCWYHLWSSMLFSLHYCLQNTSFALSKVTTISF